MNKLLPIIYIYIYIYKHSAIIRHVLFVERFLSFEYRYNIKYIHIYINFLAITIKNKINK